MVMEKYRYIFIVTYARSGSTLLQSLLNSAPGVQIRGENNNALFHIHRACRGLFETQQRGRWGQQSQPDEPWYGAGAVAAEDFCASVLETFVETVLAPALETTVTGFKEIRYVPFFMTDQEFSQYMDFLLDRFPGAKIVCNSRNAGAVSRSAWLKNEKPEAVQAFVAACDQRFKALCARSSRCIHMQYEEIIASSEPLEKLFAFLDLPYDADRIRQVLQKPLTHATGAAPKAD